MARILIVDDSQADLNFLEAALRPANHAVTAITDPEAALDAALREKPDLVMIDVVMPGRSGYDVARAMKRTAELSDLKVIFVSSKGNDTDVKWGLRQGAVDYVVKPYTPEQVLGIVARHLN
ncbi:response regulator [Deinococcus sp. KSM4-11]|uniref:response regulator n=1 Tax=Deinococcus sp. KSM4-11 TaxID=2568654 RepID=UPI0010A4184E|nr:response regulator [Deinococcus sp. KSM4-11]THF87282.1 response regulator [Deinococcus sp. KSM4-11]